MMSLNYARSTKRKREIQNTLCTRFWRSAKFTIHFIKFDTMAPVRLHGHIREKEKCLNNAMSWISSRFSNVYALSSIWLLLPSVSRLLIDVLCATWYNRQIFDEFQFNGMSFFLLLCSFSIIKTLKFLFIFSTHPLSIVSWAELTAIGSVSVCTIDMCADVWISSIRISFFYKIYLHSVLLAPSLHY